MNEAVSPETLYLQTGNDVPNNPDIPVLLYRNILDPSAGGKAAIFEKHFTANGWGGAWRNGIFAYHHFHPDAHETLGIARGSATVRLGGENGETVWLKAGDLVVLPAGTGHKRLEDDGNLLVVGAYPEGQQDYDLCRSLKECQDAQKKISAVPLPETDPFYGRTGPLVKIWMR